MLMVVVKAVLFSLTLVMADQAVVVLTFLHPLVAQIKALIQVGLHMEQMVRLVQMVTD